MKSLKELAPLYVFSFLLAILIIVLKYFEKLPTTVDVAAILNFSEWLFQNIFTGVIYLAMGLVMLGCLVLLMILAFRTVMDINLISIALRARSKNKSEKHRSDL